MANETLKTLKFGIEIETVGLSRAHLAAVIATATGATVAASDYSTTKLSNGWTVCRDGSLSGGENSGEIVSPILTYADIETMQNIVRAVRKAGARVDHSTGIHVHVDGSKLDARTIAILAKTVYKHEALLEKALQVSEARRARYCKPVPAEFVAAMAKPPKSMDQVRDAWYARGGAPTRYDSTRYYGLNLNSFFYRGTVEFRYFNGTLHAGEVKSYVQLCLAFVAKALDAKGGANGKQRPFVFETSKYDFRCTLLKLGLIGDEFETARLHLTKHLGGSAAWKGERRDRSDEEVAA
jgi:hypothetical protein